MSLTGVAPIARAMSLRDRVEIALEAAIRSGELPAGEIFSAPTLAARLNVSATPVREAMLNLEKLGFVQILRNKGFLITTVKDRDVQDIVAIRRLLEPPIMRQLVGAISDNAFVGLKSMADEIVEGASRGDLAKYLEADHTFHVTLTSFSGNQRLTDLVAQLRRETRLPGLARLIDTEELAASAEEHLQLLRLLQEGQGAEAERLMHRHIGHVLGWWAGRPESSSS